MEQLHVDIQADNIGSNFIWNLYHGIFSATAGTPRQIR